MSAQSESRPSSPSPFFVPALRDATADYYRGRDASTLSTNLRIVAGVSTEVSMWMKTHEAEIQDVLKGVDSAIAHRKEIYLQEPFEDPLRVDDRHTYQKFLYETRSVRTPDPKKTLAFVIPHIVRRLRNEKDVQVEQRVLHTFLKELAGFTIHSQAQPGSVTVSDKWSLDVCQMGNESALPELSFLLTPRRTDDLREMELAKNREHAIKKLNRLDRAKIEGLIDWVRHEGEGDWGVGSVPLGVYDQSLTPLTFEDAFGALQRSYWFPLINEGMVASLSGSYVMDPDHKGKRAVFVPKYGFAYVILVEEVLDGDVVSGVEVSARIAHDERVRQVAQRRLLTRGAKGG